MSTAGDRPAEPSVLRSSLLRDFPNGFTTRGGGVSEPPFDSLNLGGRVGDDPGRVAGNWRRLEKATGLRFARVRQVHGARVVRLDAPCDPVEEADAIVSGSAGVAATVSVADCVPILLADPGSGIVAAVHAGWRGTMAHTAAEGARALARASGAPPARLLAAVGPSIGPCCYEISPDLAAAFARVFGAGVIREGARPRLDLWGTTRQVLLDAGLQPDRVEILGRCTSCEPAVFFSHRRDAGRTGRQVGFVAPRPRVATT